MLKSTTLSFLLLLLCATAQFHCKPTVIETAKKIEEPYQPKGDMSDLLYNPVRPDGSVDSSYLPILTLIDTVYDFGTIHQGDVARHTYSFKNSGNAPLFILNASSTCGCTVPEWPEKPIPPGETGSILVKFDSAGKEGYQSKLVTIFANTYPNHSIVTIRGTVTKTK
ncbi:MAG: DUF1573 domain-containing protein [Bacteroidota bacterium]|nr:DUF1573 domain-containing protein [Bacteroidota bacterium]